MYKELPPLEAWLIRIEFYSLQEALILVLWRKAVILFISIIIQYLIYTSYFYWKDEYLSLLLGQLMVLFIYLNKHPLCL